MSRLSEILAFGSEIRKKHPTEQMWSGWWSAPSTLQPCHEHHGKIACLVHTGRKKCLVYFRDVEKPVKGEFSHFIKYIA